MARPEVCSDRSSPASAIRDRATTAEAAGLDGTGRPRPRRRWPRSSMVGHRKPASERAPFHADLVALVADGGAAAVLPVLGSVRS